MGKKKAKETTPEPVEKELPAENKEETPKPEFEAFGADTTAERLKQYDKGLFDKPEESKDEKKEEEDKKVDDSTPPEEDPKDKETAEFEASSEKEESETETKTKPEDAKMVPLSALHEEREKRKGYKNDVVDLKKKLDEVLAANLELEERSKKEVSVPETTEIDDPETAKEINDLKKTVRELQDRDDQRQQNSDQTKKDNLAKALDDRVTQVDKELEKEGYPGFSKFRNIVGDEIGKKILAEEDDYLKKQYLDGFKQHPSETNEGWKLLYKESVYPEIYGLISQKTKDNLMETKNKRQEKAELAGNPGGGSSSDKIEKKTQTYDEWLVKQRKKASAMA